MSRRRGGGRKTDLDIEFECRGLVRLGDAARILGVDECRLRSVLDGSGLLCWMDYGGSSWPGISRVDLDTLKKRMTRM